MLFRLFPLLEYSPLAFFMMLTAISGALLIAVTVHEASHAFLARWQGDETACHAGRCSFNPIRHLDPMGTAMMFLVGFGWGKPVPVNPNWLRSGPWVGGAIVALAGPASNLLTALVVATPVRLGLLPWRSPGRLSTSLDPMILVSEAVGFIVFYNVALAVFNLIPLAPLDGFRVALGILPRRAAIAFARLEQYGPGILMLLLMMSYFDFVPFGLGELLTPAVTFVVRLVTGTAA